MPANNFETLKKKTREMTISEVQEKFGEGPYKLNLGCGHTRPKGYINIDCMDIEGDDYLQLDLEVAKLPFPKGSVHEIKASHVMEHLHNFPKLMNECHRVLAPNKPLIMQVPCYPSVEAFQDPTHVRFFTDRTMLYFVTDQFLYEHVGKSYGYAGWRRLSQQRNNWELQIKLDR